MQKTVILFITLITYTACQKDEHVPSDNGQVKIISLTATDSVLKAFIDTTLVIVRAEGERLNYEWTCNHGALRGSGDTVKYAAGECCTGLNTITCRVYNDSSSVSRDINIMVTSYFENK